MRRLPAAAAVLVLAAPAWAPPPAGRPAPPPARPAPPRPAPRPPAGFTRPPAHLPAVIAGLEAARRRDAAEAAEMLRREREALSRVQRAALLNLIAADLVRQQRAEADLARRLAALRALRGDWAAVGPGAGLDPLVELELATAEAAAERAALLRALGFVDGKEYAKAAAELAPLADSRHLPVPVARAVPGLLADLRALAAVTALKPDGALPPSNSPAVPAALRPAVARVEVVRDVAKPFAGFGWPIGYAQETLAAVEKEFGPAAAAQLRVELSAAAFLDGKTDIALALLDGDIDGDRARQILADLRAAVLGEGGATGNVQIGNRLPPEQPTAALAPLVPAARRAAWRSPVPTRGETTAAALEKEARAGLVTAAAAEVERLAGPVAATAAAVRAELDARAGALAPFAGKVQARLGRPVADGDEAEVVAAAAARGLTVDDAVSLLAGPADAPARAARVVGAALAPAAHLAVAGRPPASLKPGEDGGFRAPAEVAARDRGRVREAVRAALAAAADADRAGFEAAVGRAFGSVPPDDLASALFDAARDLAAAHAGTAADLRSLADALDRLDGIAFDDPDDAAAVRKAKVRRDELTQELSAGAGAVRATLRLLAEYGPAAPAARPWLAEQRGSPWAAAAAAVPLVATAPAPVPKGAKPPVGCAITLDPKADPFAEKSLTVRLTNNTPDPIELSSSLPGGVRVFLDVEVQDPAGKRVSTEFYYAAISSPYFEKMNVGTLRPGEPEVVGLVAFASVPSERRERLAAGTYRVRVTFKYDRYTAVSDWAAVEFKGGK
ncbi:MAG: hypothetical protein C0501_10810 [Isosphaera sp.]|nr:hypothetical protein [Isosphaera sp.]